jgi:transcriptional regulator with XRE-family HTH domain
VHRHPSLKVLGRNLRRQREKREFTQEKLGELAELDPTYISGIERGIRNPSLLSLLRIAKGLGVPVADLCKGVDA